jgi:hypothetical protein
VFPILYISVPDLEITTMADPVISIVLHREVVWVLFAQFWIGLPCFCCRRCGHVGNALALSIMSSAMRCAYTVDGDSALLIHYLY